MSLRRSFSLGYECRQPNPRRFDLVRRGRHVNMLELKSAQPLVVLQGSLRSHSSDGRLLLFRRLGRCIVAVLLWLLDKRPDAREHLRVPHHGVIGHDDTFVCPWGDEGEAR